jgi:hypothetical protein
MNEGMDVLLWWNDAERGEPKYTQKILSQCHFAHDESRMD